MRKSDLNLANALAFKKHFLKIVYVNLGGKSLRCPEWTEIEMLMEMPFGMTLVSAPFRWAQSEKTGIFQLCLLKPAFKEPQSRENKKSMQEREQAIAIQCLTRETPDACV